MPARSSHNHHRNQEKRRKARKPKSKTKQPRKHFPHTHAQIYRHSQCNSCSCPAKCAWPLCVNPLRDAFSSSPASPTRKQKPSLLRLRCPLWCGLCPLRCWPSCLRSSIPHVEEALVPCRPGWLLPASSFRTQHHHHPSLNLPSPSRRQSPRRH